MNMPRHVMPPLLCLFLLTALASLGLPDPARALVPPQPEARQTIAAALDPQAKSLRVTALIELVGSFGPEIAFTLSPRAARTAVSDGSHPVRFVKAGATLRVPLTPGVNTLFITYSLPLDAPPASLPPSQDNPGALAADGVCGPDWAMLMPGSLWHPQAQGARNSYRLRVTAPQGVKAVTQGHPAGFSDRAGVSESAWEIPNPQGRLGLCAARYHLEQTAFGSIPVQTFLLEANQGLAQTYLDAAKRHLEFYSALHGPYRFEKFAVVENPLPTGYGFASYTLLGSQVIALPFIPETSLRHEIAHCWWGNGVLLDASQGNWCEGLTTYVADYLAEEQASPGQARAYRLKTLRSFTTLAAASGQDFPLERFGSRSSAAAQAVGYGKAMSVFHMLRGFTGDEAFWNTLRTLYATHLFQPATWEDIRAAFAGQPNFGEARSKRFFQQWLTRTGAPTLRLTGVSLQDDPAGGHVLTATVSQEGEPYLLSLALAAETPAGNVSQRFILDGPSATVSLRLPAPPSRVAVDPDADCLRLLAPGEIPPTVNSVKAAKDLTVVLADQAPDSVRQALPRLLESLGRHNARILAEKDLPVAATRQAMLWAGEPRQPEPGAQDPFGLAPGADTVFAVLPGPDGAFTAIFAATPDAAPQDVAAAAAKVTHYGSMSVTGFAKARNVARITLDPPASPLVWTPPQE